MPSYNKIVGHLTKDREEVCFVDITIMGKTGEAAGEHLSKGDCVLVEGRLKLDKWEKDGVNHYKHSIFVTSLQFLKVKKWNSENGSSSPDDYADDDIPF